MSTHPIYSRLLPSVALSTVLMQHCLQGARTSLQEAGCSMRIGAHLSVCCSAQAYRSRIQLCLQGSMFGLRARDRPSNIDGAQPAGCRYSELSWDVVEPVTYFTSQLWAILGYCYFLVSLLRMQSRLAVVLPSNCRSIPCGSGHQQIALGITCIRSHA